MKRLGFAEIIHALAMASAAGPRAKHVPTRPSILREQQKRAFAGKMGKRKRVSYQIDEFYRDNTRYPGHVLRQIRATGQARECARRRARGCVQ
jgi:hypothetical protein